MKPILLIAPHLQIMNAANELLKSDKITDVEIVHRLLEDSLSVSRTAAKEGVEAIISRGGTAKILESSDLNIPIIEIPVSPYELINSIHSAKQFGRNILILGFKSIIEGVEALGPMLDLNIRAHLIKNVHDGQLILEKTLRAGIKVDVLLGGTSAELLAQEYEIPTVPLLTSPLTIESSIKEARRLIAAMRREKEKTEQMQAILNNISEGIIAIDQQKNVTIFNDAAINITGIIDSDISGKAIDQIIPGTKLVAVMESSIPELGRLQKIGKSTVLTNRVPVIVKDRTVGAVATFEDVTKIQEYEQLIRGKLREKGHVARYCLEDIKGNSPALLLAKSDAQKFSAVDGTVLIEGESGTGKEMFAQGLHQLSSRKHGPFVAVNCAAISHSLLESELFGYEQGAYTGARKEGKHGLFVEANRGTIFLDEVSEIDPDVQARLLRVLQEREVRPLGSNKVIPVDVRIVAATNKTLAHEVRNGSFRADLFYRLNILKLKVPPLRERGQDCEELIQHFFQENSNKFSKNLDFEKNAIRHLLKYHWPGNIRELENIIERLIVLADDVVTESNVVRCLEDMSEVSSLQGLDIEQIKHEHILKVLTECGGNKTRASQRLGISRTHLWRILKAQT